MCYHVPYFLSSCGIKRFTGQGVEKTNDVIRRLYHLKSNKFDACKDGLQAVKRLDDLQGFECKPRNYSQHDAQYMTTAILEERRKRPRLSVVPREDEMTIEEMSFAAIKTKLKEMNIKTRIRNLDKLRQLLRDAIYASS